MDDFDWIIDHKVIPDLKYNPSFDGITVVVPRSICVVEYDGVTHLEILPRKAKQTPLRDYIRDKFYDGRRVYLPLFLKVKLKVVENRNYMSDKYWYNLTQEQRDEMTKVRVYWCGIEKLHCFYLPIKNVKELYKNNMIRLGMALNPIL